MRTLVALRIRCWLAMALIALACGQGSIGCGGGPASPIGGMPPAYILCNQTASNLQSITVIPSAINLVFEPATCTFTVTVPAWAQQVVLEPRLADNTIASSKDCNAEASPPNWPTVTATDAAIQLDLCVNIDDQVVGYHVFISKENNASPVLFAGNAGVGDLFGSSVAMSGDTIAIGVPHESSNAIGINGDPNNDLSRSSGAVYVYRNNNNVWQLEAYIKSSNTDANDQFGGSVALSGDTLVVGAWGEDSSAINVGGEQKDNFANASGAVYVFRRNGTVWTQEAYIKASNTEADDRFGWSVAIGGDLLAVGATGESSDASGINGSEGNNSSGGSGAVYVYRRSGVTWVKEAYLKASNTGAGDLFGWSVSISDNLLAVSAILEASASVGINATQTNDDAFGAGVVYMFRRDSSRGTWQQDAYIKASNAGKNDRFGYSLALAGTRALVGAPFEASRTHGVGGDQQDNSSPTSGAAYVFERSGNTWMQTAYLKAAEPGPGNWFGSSVALSESYLLVGAHRLGLSGNDATSGRAYVFASQGGSWRQLAALSAPQPQNSDGFGWAVAIAGSHITACANRSDGGGGLSDSGSCSVY